MKPSKLASERVALLSIEKRYSTEVLIGRGILYSANTAIIRTGGILQIVILVLEIFQPAVDGGLRRGFGRVMAAEVCRRRGSKVNAGKSKMTVLNREEGLECEVHVDGICLEHLSI